METGTSLVARQVRVDGNGQIAGTRGGVDVSATVSVHEANIEKVAAAGIVLGGTDGRFRPNEDVTRAQMASILARALGL